METFESSPSTQSSGIWVSKSCLARRLSWVTLMTSLSVTLGSEGEGRSGGVLKKSDVVIAGILGEAGEIG